MDDPTHAYCFLDTNVLIHFPTFDEVDWQAKLGLDNATLVLAPVVLSEVDKLKTDHTKPWQQERARMLIRKFRTLLESNSPGSSIDIRPFVALVDVGSEPGREFFEENGLEFGWMDDRLIATILEFRVRHQGARTVLVCDDFSVVRKARYRQIEVIMAEDTLTRLPVTTHQEAELRRLRTEIQTLRSCQPRLTLTFMVDDVHTCALDLDMRWRCDTWPDDDALNAQLENARTDVLDTIARAPNLLAQPAPDDFMLRFGGFPERDTLPSYKRKAEEYLYNLQAALPAKRAFACGAIADLSFHLRNDGSVPAEDLRIELAFPLGSLAIDPDEEQRDFAVLGAGLTMINGLLHLPGAPMEPWEPRQNHHLLNPLPQYSPLAPSPRGPLVYSHDLNRALYRHPKFLQKDDWLLPAIRVYLPPSLTSGAEVKYTLRADNLPEPGTGSLALRALKMSGL